MSSVGGSEGNNNNDAEVRRLREQYKQREAELVKRHSKEVRNLTEASQTEVERIRAQNEANVQSMRDKSRETISRRDAKYQNQMDQMRKMHTSQLDRIMKDSDVKLRTQREVAQSEVKSAKLGKEDRVQELDQKYRSNIAEARENFERQVNDAREQQKRSLDHFKENMNEKHSEKYGLQKDYYDRRLMELKNDLRTTRQSSRDRLRNKEVNFNRDKMRMQETFMDEMKRRDVSNQELAGTQREGFQESLSDIRQRARIANEKAQESAYNQHENLKSSVLGRVEDREKRLERQISDLKASNIRNETKYKQEAKGEVKRWQDSYDNKFEMLEDARVDTVNEQNKINAKNIKAVRKEAVEVIQANNRYMKNQMETEVFKSKEALDSQESEYKLRTDYHKENAESRIGKIREESFVKDERQREVYERNLEELKRGHAEEITQLRTKMLEEKTQQLQALKSQIQKKEVDHTRQLESVVQKYEKRIADLNDQFTREKRLAGNREKQLTESLQRAADQEKEILRVKFQEKHQQSVAQHNEEKQRMSISHKEQIDNIMSQARKT